MRYEELIAAVVATPPLVLPWLLASAVVLALEVVMTASDVEPAFKLAQPMASVSRPRWLAGDS